MGMESLELGPGPNPIEVETLNNWPVKIGRIKSTPNNTPINTGCLVLGVMPG